MLTPSFFTINRSNGRQVWGLTALSPLQLNNSLQITPSDDSLVQIDQIDPTAAVIYPILFDDRLEVIVHLPRQPLRHYTTFLPQKDVKVVLERFLSSIGLSARVNPTRELRRGFIAEVLPRSPRSETPEEREKREKEVLLLRQKVYDWLIRPVEADLAKSQVKTLVFVMDGSFRNLPLAALHDGKQFLIEKYGIAVTPSLQLLETQPSERRPLRVLLAGVSEARQGFNALPYVQKELTQISAEIPGTVLLNQDFTSTAVKNAINSLSFPIVHLATTGESNSKAEDTFIVTWDNRINANQLGDLLQAINQSRASNIELLVLSACQTANRGRETPFGLTGIALRSGVRSTIGALGNVSDEATAKLMTRFYQELANNSKITKAEALRRAQVALLKDSSYQQPSFWAPYVLVGDWR